ncbi:glycosyltransferase family 2 protein [Paenibacillus castaneae]|nr:glycosyltransferase family 2 protein [Paenibacillus castaneae]
MSTYNGEKYISEQIQSILDQENVNVHLLIRDDGSTDKTVEIINSFMKKYSDQIMFYAAENIGVKDSFLELLKNSNEMFDYFAFSDQDDYWLPNKLFAGINYITNSMEDGPILYCSRTTLVDEDLKRLVEWPPVPKRPLKLNNSLVENVVVGCTMIINIPARKLLIKLRPNTQNIIMHDWWMYLCISAFGRVYFDKQSNILYRQHSNNLIGGERSIFKKWSKKFRNVFLKLHNNIRSIQALEFNSVLNRNKVCFSEIETLTEFNAYVTYSVSKRLKYSFKNKLYRQSKMESVLLKALLLIARV